jgi:tetratricopeptide (TPR) repeat protein
MEHMLPIQVGAKKQSLRLRLAQLLRNRNKSDQAIEYLDAVMADDTDTQTKAQALLELGQNFEKKKDIDQAIQTYRRLEEIDPAHKTVATFRKGLAYFTSFRRDNLLNAQGEFKKLLGSAKDDPHTSDMVVHARIALAEIDFFLGNKDSALKEFQEVVAEDSASTHQERAWCFIAQIDYEAQRYSDSLSECVRLEEAQEVDVRAMAMRYRVLNLLALSQFEDAEAVIKKQEPIDRPLAEELRSSKAAKLEADKRFIEALDDWRKLSASTNPAMSASALIGGINCFIQLKQFDQAEDWLKQLDSDHPDRSDFVKTLRTTLEMARQQEAG